MPTKKLPTPALRTIALGDLVVRRNGANRLPPRVRRAIADQIAQTGLYPPLIVRARPRSGKHLTPSVKGKFEILDGAQRADILAELGHTTARCEVWPVGDRQAEIIAATINHLRGRPAAQPFARQIRRLLRLLGEQKAGKTLALSPAGVRQRLMALDRPAPIAELKTIDLRPVTFHLPAAELASLEKALAGLADGSQKRGELLMAAVRGAVKHHTRRKE